MSILSYFISVKNERRMTMKKFIAGVCAGVLLVGFAIWMASGFPVITDVEIGKF